KSGVTGHETCYEPPEGLDFVIDPHCAIKYLPDGVGASDTEVEYHHRLCTWTDMDCDACTGFDGKETFSLWRDPAGTPAPPHWRVGAGDAWMRAEWENKREVRVAANIAQAKNVRFIGYNIYRLDDWQGRPAEIPTPVHFQQVAAFARDTSFGAQPLAEAVD